MTRRMCLALLASALLTTPATQPAAAQSAPSGKWIAEDILGAGVIDRIQTTLEFSGDGRVAGSGGCNRFFGSVKIEGDKIALGPMGSTRMACLGDAVMKQEANYFKALEAARSWQIDEAKRRLLLRDGNGKLVLRFARMP